MADPGDVRDRIMDAVVECVDRVGLSGFALEDVASAAGLGRATIYRHFAGGRAQLVRETVTREVSRFWQFLAESVAAEPDLEGRLVAGLMVARQRLADYDLLQRLLVAEPDELLPALLSSEPLLLQIVRDYLRKLLDRSVLAEGVDIDEAADYLTRMLLGYIGTAGRWDMTDRGQVERLVRTQFLAGIIDPATREVSVQQ